MEFLGVLLVNNRKEWVVFKTRMNHLNTSTEE